MPGVCSPVPSVLGVEGIVQVWPRAWGGHDPTLSGLESGTPRNAQQSPLLPPLAARLGWQPPDETAGGSRESGNRWAWGWGTALNTDYETTSCRAGLSVVPPRAGLIQAQAQPQGHCSLCCFPEPLVLL